MKNKLRMFLRICLLSMLAIAVTSSVFAADPSKIHVDQVGYLPQYPKVAIVAATQGVNEFTVVNAETNAIVYKGTLSAPVKDVSSGDAVRQADFSAVTAAGTYVIAIDGIGRSYTFKIAEDVYNIPLIHALRSYTLGRCNTAIDDPITGLSYGVTHEKDKAAILYFSDDGVSTKGETVDVSGGWYDAGDFGKYTPTGGVVVANILLAYEIQPEKFKKDQMFFPKSVSTVGSETGMPDLLVEMKYELDWMLKMQRSDGAFYAKVAGRFWPDLKTNPVDDKQKRFIYGLSTYGTAICGAANAMAARSYEKYDPQYAAQLLASAEKAFSFLESHPTAIFRIDDGQDNGSGPYDKKTDIEERIWLAAELFKTTGDAKYEQYLKKQMMEKFTSVPDFFGWMNTLALGQWAYITNNKADETIKAKVKKAFLDYADATVKVIAADGYKCSLKATEYTWASSKNAATKANMLVLAYQLQPKEEYRNGALDQIHYVFGRNTNGVSYMTGAGTKPPMHPHNRVHESTGVYVPGLLVGGPNNWPGGDTLQAKMLAASKVFPAKAYWDVNESYSTNEYAIDYTAPMTFALAYFSKTDVQLTPDDIKLHLSN